MGAGNRIPGSAEPGEVWLGKATVHLVAACGAPQTVLSDVAAGVTPTGLGAPADLAAGGAAAFLDRLDESRLSVLCSALAAEAFVNEFVHARGPSYRHLLDGLPPAERFSLAPKLLSASDRFEPGSRLHMRLVRLFELRGELVAPPSHAGTAAALYTAVHERFNARTALEMLEACADAAEALAQLYGPVHRSMPGFALRVAKALAGRAEAAAAVPVPVSAELEEEGLAAVRFPAEELIGA